MLPARVRFGEGWSDACILNLSSGGLLIYSHCTATPGNWVEVRRGGELVNARVVWRTSNRIGLCSQHAIDVHRILNDRTTAAAAAVPLTSFGPAIDRRVHPRDAAHSQARSRLTEFMAIVLLTTAIGGLAAVSVLQTLHRPMAAMAAALDRR